MKWSITVWMVAALVVATTALHLTIEQNLLSKHDDGPTEDLKVEETHSTTISGQLLDVVHIINGSEEYVVSKETYDEETEEVSGEHSSQVNSKEQSGSLSTSTEKAFKSNEIEDVNVQNPDGTNNGVTDGETTVSGEGDGTESGVTEGDANGEADGETDGDSDAGENGAAEDDNTVIQTTTGEVRGHAWRENANIISYIDIQYGTFKSPFEVCIAPIYSRPRLRHDLAQWRFKRFTFCVQCYGFDSCTN